MLQLRPCLGCLQLRDSSLLLDESYPQQTPVRTAIWEMKCLYHFPFFPYLHYTTLHYRDLLLPGIKSCDSFILFFSGPPTLLSSIFPNLQRHKRRFPTFLTDDESFVGASIVRLSIYC